MKPTMVKEMPRVTRSEHGPRVSSEKTLLQQLELCIERDDYDQHFDFVFMLKSRSSKGSALGIG